MLRIYNTLSRKKEIFRPRKALRSAQGKVKVNLFVCGVTTYDFSHLGHARTYIAFDAIVKYLRHKGYSVFYLQNVTDVDDKIIKRAQENGESPKKLALRFEKEYLKDMKALGVNAVSAYARATAHIPEIISQVQRMLKKGYAYEIAGDGIYFDISKFKEYGKLSGRTSEQAQDAVSRIDESIHKRNKGDFALWKYSKRDEPSWRFGPPATPRKPRLPMLGTSGQVGLRGGRGRPGWHIEDTAIAEKFFGPQYDVHGGAQDLIFPHHEAEVTQMESISRPPFVKYWMHTGFLTVKGEKMSKSLGNFVTIRDFLASPKLEERRRARLLRYFVLKTHYRSPIDYSEDILQQSESELERMDEFVDKLKVQSSKLKTKTQNLKLKKFKIAFEKAIEDDFNTASAISILFDLIRQGNILLDAKKLSKAQAKEILDFFKQIDKFFGFIFWGRETQHIPTEITRLAQQREAHRKQGNFQEADALRKAIHAKGWNVEDTPSGPKLKRAR